MTDDTDDDWLNTVEPDKTERTDDGQDPVSDDATRSLEDESDERSLAQQMGYGMTLPIVVPLRVVKVILLTFFTTLIGKIPVVRSKFWRDMIKWTTYKYQKATGADVVNLSAEPHGIEPRAANWVEADPDEPDQEPGWQEAGRGDKTWGPGTEGKTVERFGKADVILADRAAHKTATPLQLRYAEALDLEQTDGVIVEPEITQTVVQQWPKNPAEIDGDQGQAVADGGAMARQHVEQPVVNPEDIGLDDALVDLASDFGDGKGMRVSARKYKHQKLSTTDAEEMQKQETRGFLAGKSGRDESDLIKLFIIVLVVIAIVAVGPEFVQVLFGNGGGGGSTLPIFAGLVG